MMMWVEYRRPHQRSHHCSSIPFDLNPNRRVVVVSGCCYPLRRMFELVIDQERAVDKEKMKKIQD